MGVSAEDIVELFERDVKARRRLAELLVMEPDVRLAIINAVLRDVATKQDIAELRRSIEAKIEREIDGVRREIGMVEGEMDGLFRLVMVSVLGTMVSIATTISVGILLP